MTNNNNATVLTTPIGLSGFATLTEGQLRDDGFGYSLDLFLDPKNNNEHKEFLDTLLSLHSQNIDMERTINGATNSRDLNMSIATKADFDFLSEGVEYTRVKFKSQYAPGIFDSAGKEVSLNQYLPFNSQVRARITVKSYTDRRKTAGTSLYLGSVQIAQLGESKNSKGSSGASSFSSISDGDFIGLGTNVDDISL